MILTPGRSKDKKDKKRAIQDKMSVPLLLSISYFFSKPAFLIILASLLQEISLPLS